MEYKDLKKNYIGLDVFRVICALATCAFHTSIFLGANYGIFSSVVDMGAIFMTAFFMLSGFSLFVNYSGQDIIKMKILKLFWKKRVVGVIPMYYVVAMLIVLWGIADSPAIEETIVLNLLLAPIEALCLQTNFSSLFDYTHNGITWFVSCVMMCYVVYPFLQEVVKQLKLRDKKYIIVISSFILLYSPIIVRKFEISSIYSNPFFRILEFIIGITLASLKIEFDKHSFVKKYVFNWFSIVIAMIIMIIGVTVAVKSGFAIGDYMMYSWICLPCFMFILFGVSGVNSVKLEKSKILSYCCRLSYVFYLSQWFSNGLSQVIIAKYSITNNLVVVLLGWIICIIISIVLHETVEKPIGKMLKKRVFGNNNL